MLITNDDVIKAIQSTDDADNALIAQCRAYYERKIADATTALQQHMYDTSDLLRSPQVNNKVQSSHSNNDDMFALITNYEQVKKAEIASLRRECAEYIAQCELSKLIRHAYRRLEYIAPREYSLLTACYVQHQLRASVASQYGISVWTVYRHCNQAIERIIAMCNHDKTPNGYRPYGR